jgi:hypothetical protein
LRRSIYVALLQIGDCNVARSNCDRNRGACLEIHAFHRCLDFQLSGGCTNKAFTISSVRWLMTGYNVTDDTAR